MVALEQGVHAVYKPKGMTSHDVVHQIKKQVGDLKVGHAGTLDPLASGVLVVGVGRESTKQLRTNTNNVEYDDATYTALDFLSNGFKWRTAEAQVNGAVNFIYVAFAETPFKYSNAR